MGLQGWQSDVGGVRFVWRVVERGMKKKRADRSPFVYRMAIKRARSNDDGAVPNYLYANLAYNNIT